MIKANKIWKILRIKISMRISMLKKKMNKLRKKMKRWMKNKWMKKREISNKMIMKWTNKMKILREYNKMVTKTLLTMNLRIKNIQKMMLVFMGRNLMKRIWNHMKTKIWKMILNFRDKSGIHQRVKIWNSKILEMGRKMQRMKLSNKILIILGRYRWKTKRTRMITTKPYWINKLIDLKIRYWRKNSGHLWVKLKPKRGLLIVC